MTSTIRIVAVVIGALGMHACAGSDDLALSEQNQEERIEIHACQVGYIQVGDGEDMVCVDPWEDWGAPGDNSGGRYGGGESTPGGGGGTQTEPRPVPRMDCSELRGQPCEDCCYHNFMWVDGGECRKIRDKDARRLCWINAGHINAACNALCHRDRLGPLPTGTP
jgi:hypothetical protein